MDRFNFWVGSLIAGTHDLKKDDGQTFVEYALVLTLIAVAAAALAAWGGLVGALKTAIEAVSTAL